MVDEKQCVCWATFATRQRRIKQNASNRLHAIVNEKQIKNLKYYQCLCECLIVYSNH